MTIAKTLSIASAFIILIGTSACTNGVKVHEITGGETSATTPTTEKTDEAASPDDGKKASDPMPPVDSPIIATPVPFSVAPLAPLPEKTVTGVSISPSVDNYYVPCEDCASGEGTSQTFMCPPNSVVTGYELGYVDIWTKLGFKLDTDSVIVGGLKIKCSPLALNAVDSTTTAYAFTLGSGGYSSGEIDNQAGDIATDNLSDNCESIHGIASGLFGRHEGHLVSFGLFCGHYFSTKFIAGVLPTFNKTTSCDETVDYGCAPGTSGKPFEVKCDVNQAIVGVTIPNGSDVNGIDGIYCADIKAVSK